MVPWWKRLVYSLASVVVAVVLCYGFIFGRMASGKLSGHPLGGDFLTSVALTLICCIPGWLVAAPLVLMVRNVGGWRVWALWAAGSCIGPALIYLIALLAFHGFAGFRSAAPEANDFLSLAATISCLATLLYLLLVRRSEAHAARELLDA
jgi:hypothetical protein